MRLREPQRVQGAHAVDLERVDGMPEVVPGARGTGKVQDEIDGIVDDERLRHIVAQEAEPRVAGQVGQIPGLQIGRAHV